MSSPPSMGGTSWRSCRDNEFESDNSSMEFPLRDAATLPVPRSNARRRLVRGAFAAPAVMTVCSGSALAASSSLRCVAHQAGTGTSVPVSDATDAWVRVRLWTQGASANYFISGADVVALKRASATAYIGPTAWQPFDIKTNTAGVIGGDGNGKQQSVPAKYAAIRVDASGNIVGVGATGGGAAIAGTCWTSFMIAP